MSGYDGVLISELGAELYLEGRQVLNTSNVSFLWAFRLAFKFLGGF